MSNREKDERLEMFWISRSVETRTSPPPLFLEGKSVNKSGSQTQLVVNELVCGILTSPSKYQILRMEGVP